MEKRNFTRVLYQSEAIVKCKELVVQGEISNLSLNGMFVNTTEQFPMDESVDIKILLSGASSELQIDLKGKVVRREDDGVGIQFKEMDLDSFIHLKNVIAYNRGDENEVMEELYAYMKRCRTEDF